MTTINAIVNAARGLIKQKPLTTDSILAAHSKAITDLETVASTQTFQAEQADAEIARQNSLKAAALAEAQRAATVAGKMKAIFA